MANKQHLDILRQGVDAWNNWREENSNIQPDFMEANLRNMSLDKANLTEVNLTEADLRGAGLMGANLTDANLTEADLREANLWGANLTKADLREANLWGANLTDANLTEANLREANLMEANLRGVNLRGADLMKADLREANLTEADLREANLMETSLVETNFEKANLTNCRIYGISAWGLKLHDATQANLTITPHNEPTVTVDDFEVAQFIYLLLNNERINRVIDTITSKIVLILGRFTKERKAILDAIREELRKRDYLPVLFDFDNPGNRDLTETAFTLAHLARFVIADVTDARNIPEELERIVPDLPSVPIQPLLQAQADKYGMFKHFKRYPWVLKIHQYEDLDDLLKSLVEKVIVPAEAKVKELREK